MLQLIIPHDHLVRLILVAHRVDEQGCLSVEGPVANSASMFCLMSLHVDLKLSLLLKSHPTFGALKLLGISVPFLMHISSVHVCELPIADFAVVIALSIGIVDHSQMNQKASP